MEDTLRSLAESNVESFEISCSIGARRNKARRWRPRTTFDSLLNPEEESAAGPLFAVDLVVKEDSKKSENSSFQFTTSVDRFEPAVLDVLENGVRSLHGIKSLEPGIMSHLHWTTWPVTASVQMTEPLVADARASPTLSKTRSIP